MRKRAFTMSFCYVKGSRIDQINALPGRGGIYGSAHMSKHALTMSFCYVKGSKIDTNYAFAGSGGIYGSAHMRKCDFC